MSRPHASGDGGQPWNTYAGIDVSLERSSVCVVDALGKIVKEAKSLSSPERINEFLSSQ